VLKPWLTEQWCLPSEADGEFVARMEALLEVYRRPYDPARPVVGLDETSSQLIGEARAVLPPEPGRPERVDYEYVRNGVCALFMAVEPLAGWRQVTTSDRRTRTDFAAVVKVLLDDRYPDAERVVLVLDNLNTHTLGALYEAFPAPEARRLAERLELHYRPKHGSWLNIAEIELSVLARQCLGRRIPTAAQLEAETTAWATDRNRRGSHVDWQFTTEDARIKLKRLYPVFHA
jgi:DDE superfamily endonuclease